MLHLHELDNIYEFSPLSASYQGPIPLHLTPLTTSHPASYSTRPSQRLFAPPACNLSMMAREQYIRHAPAAKLWRARIVWILQQVPTMRLLLNRCVCSQHARNETAHGIHYDHRRQFPARQYVVTYRDFICHHVLVHALINSLVVPAEQRHTLLLGKRSSYLLVEEPPLGSQEDDRSTFIDSLYRGKNRLRLHHHTCATAIRIIINDVGLISSDIANIVQGNAEQSTFLSALEDALSEWPLKHIWKECEDVEMHGILTISIETMSSVVIGCRYFYNNTAVYCWQDVKYQHDSMILRAYSMGGISGLSNRGARAAAVGVVLRCLYPKYNNSRICMIK